MRIVLFSLLLFLSLPALAADGVTAADSVTYDSFLRDGRVIRTGVCGNIEVAVDMVNGLNEPVITIANRGGERFDFHPDDITAYVYGLKQMDKYFRYRIGYMPYTRKDMGKFERDTLSVMPYSQYRKRMVSQSVWGGVLFDAIVGVVYSDNTDADRLLSEKTSDDYDDVIGGMLKSVDEQYWRSNTIFPNTSHVGYVHIKKLKSDNLVLDIPVDGINFHFEILPEKYME